ncbi:MAG: hypothetical protein J0M04_14290 [Verrucomicrobia bacterium]|nr:hypothetical protein [Verrucomicrobiota bacterium]
MLIAAGMLGYAIAESIRMIGPNGSALPVFGTLLGLCLLFTAWIERNPISWLVLQWKRWLEYNNPPPLRQETPSAASKDQSVQECGSQIGDTPSPDR